MSLELKGPVKMGKKPIQVKERVTEIKKIKRFSLQSYPLMARPSLVE
jgi:hypothetical protein